MKDLGIIAVTIAGALFVAGLLEPHSAQPAQLIGLCNGQVLAAMEEDQFPKGCDWIEPIHFQEEFL